MIRKTRFSSVLSKLSALVVAAVVSLALPGCNLIKRGSSAEKPTLSKCLSDLNTIPMLAGVLKSRSKEEDEAGTRPFEGMEIALTFSGMIQSKGDPEAELDSWCEAENSYENFTKLITALKQNQMPPIVSFVSGRFMDIALLGEWLDKGNLVGNMTFSRKKARKKDAQEFIADIVKNEEALAPLWKKHKPEQRYFRYPRLKINRDRDEREQVDKYLAENKYLTAFATIKANSRQFSEIYCSANARGDQQCASLIKAHFKTLLLDTTLKAREAAKKRAGGEIKHILLVEANQFICDNLADILAWYKNLGVKFIPLKTALADPFYAMTDDKGRSIARAIIRDTKRAQLLSMKALDQ